MPKEFTTLAFVAGLKTVALPGEKLLIARGDLGNPELILGLSEQGIQCHEVILYKTLENKVEKGELLELLDLHKINAITFTSPSTVKGFMKLLDHEYKDQLCHTKIVTIGPVTSEAVEELGFEVAGEAAVFTEEGLVDRLLELMGVQDAKY